MSNWKLIDVSGTTRDLRDYYNFTVRFAPGAGMTPVNNISTDFGLLDGAAFQRTRIPTRSFELLGYISGSSVTDLHTGRKNLINAIKSDRTASQVPVVIQYVGSTCTVQASCFYDGGLEFGNTFNVYDELEVGFRFIQLDPYWESPTSTSQALAVQSFTGNINKIIQRDLTTGCWSSMASGVNGAVNTIITDPYTGHQFVGGNFTFAGSATTAAFTACRLARWTPSTSTWSSLSRGVGNDPADEVFGLALAPGGSRLYAVGNFTVAGSSGTTTCRVAQCIIATCAWSAMGTGANASVLCVAVGPDGLVYVGGGFTSIGGVTASYVAYWNPITSVWSNMCMGSASGVGTVGGNGVDVNSIVVGQDNSVYVAGNFLLAGGVAASRIAKWTPSTCTWSALGAGAGDEVNGIDLMPDGTLVTVGAFTSNGSATASRASSWNGGGWSSMGTGLNALPKQIDADTGGFAYAIGAFSMAGGLSVPDGAARWNRSSWSAVGVDLAGSNDLYSVNIDSASNRLTLGFSGATNITASTAAVTVVTNGGTADTYPVLTASGPGRLYEFRNITTGEEIYFNIMLNAGEVVTLDLRPGKKTFSSNFRGNIINNIQPGSNVATWRLISGSNAVSLFISGCTTSASARLTWTPRYWSIDT